MADFLLDNLSSELKGIDVSYLNNFHIFDFDVEGNEVKQNDQDLDFEQEDNLLDDQLQLKVLAQTKNETIYQLSDLYIPVDKRVKKKIDQYNQSILSAHEKESKEKQLTQDEKEEEMRNMCRKAKRSQKNTRVSFFFDEKLFDKTFFLNKPREKKSAPVPKELNKQIKHNESDILKLKEFYEKDMISGIYEGIKAIGMPRQTKKSIGTVEVFIPRSKLNRTERN